MIELLELTGGWYFSSCMTFVYNSARIPKVLGIHGSCKILIPLNPKP